MYNRFSDPQICEFYYQDGMWFVHVAVTDSVFTFDQAKVKAVATPDGRSLYGKILAIHGVPQAQLDDMSVVEKRVLALNYRASGKAKGNGKILHLLPDGNVNYHNQEEGITN